MLCCNVCVEGAVSLSDGSCDVDAELDVYQEEGSASREGWALVGAPDLLLGARVLPELMIFEPKLAP